MYVLRRFIGIGFLVAIYLIIAGGYDAFIQGTARQNPETISIPELQKNLPTNRHLIVTGGTAVVAKAVEYYQTRHGVRVPNSEIYFIPIQDSSLPPSASAIPPLLVKMTKDQLDKVKVQGGLESSRIEGVRMTHWDLESKAKDYLVASFGNSGVEKMVVLDYQRQVVGIWRGMGQILGGFVLLGALMLASAKLNQPRPTPQTSLPPSPSRATPPPLSKTGHVGSGRKRMVFVVVGGAIALLLCVILFSNENWRELLATRLTAQWDDWRDWQLPVRIGDSLEAVRTKLGQESYDGNRVMDKYEKQHHLGGYGHDIDRQKLAAEGTITLIWQDKGLAVYFQNGRARSITASTTDRPERDNDERMRKYDGPIIAGVTAADRLEGLLAKLGKPSEVTEFNPNDKDYLWRRKDYVITTRIALKDLVTTGLPFKTHEMEGEITLVDIAPFLQAERDKQLQAEALQKEKALIAITGATLTPKEIFQKYSGRVVEVQTLDSRGTVVSTGTGFMWRGDEILTNCHIIEKARALKVRRGADTEGAFFASYGITGRFSHFSFEQDWAQLFLSNSHDLPPVVSAPETPEVGENVTVIGNPERLTNSLSTGIVAGIRQVEGNSWIQITAPISPGSSGSPVFDSKGRLIGLATMMMIDGQNLNFATAIGQIAAGVAVETKPGITPFRTIANDKTFERKKQALITGSHTPEEIKTFAEEFGSKYSDPEDKGQIFYAVADAYEAQGQFRNAVKMMQLKMERFGTDLDDYSRIADLLEETGDVVAMKRDLREGITSGIRKFAKEHLPDSRDTAATVAYMFDKLQDREGAARWFDIHLALLLPDIAEWSLPRLPKWYQSERAAREKIETDADRLTPKDADAYIDSLRERWRSQVEKETVGLLHSWGLSEEKAKQMLRMGIDSIPASYWEEQIRPRLTPDQWLLLREKLDERKSL
ncbi:MAG TPA: serine protease [Chthoniobacterales bacterium]|jgi:hypothetical protein|nr:serine protease [Chthoniobacterales bacterium]